MNAKMKKRLVAVSGVIIIVLILVLAFVGGNSAAKTVSVAEAAELTDQNQKIQVTGNVVPESFSTENAILTFRIYDPDATSEELEVRYGGAAASTFGNDVTAICTGKVGADGVLEASELVTKCPSKYESGTDALTVDRLLGYGSEITGTMVKVAGEVKPGTLGPAGQTVRFALVDPVTGAEVPVAFDGALADAITDDTAVVLTGSMGSDGMFDATDVALEG